MVEFDRWELANSEHKKYESKSNIWRTIFIIFLILIIIGIIGEILLFQVYQKELSQQQIKATNESFQIGYNQGLLVGVNQGKNECPTCTTTACPFCESPNATVKNIATEQTYTGNIILYNGTNVVSLPIKSLCQQLLQNGTIPT
jgi:amino acid transporter